MTFLNALATAGIVVAVVAAFIDWIFFSAWAWSIQDRWTVRVFNLVGWVLIIATVLYAIGQTEAGRG